MANADLLERFPEMEPIRRAPTLWRINGIGFGAYGRRDRDPETDTYVKTQCLSILWVPLLAMRAFRVAAAEGGGWIFLGRVPLSAFAKAWNVVALVAIAGLIGTGWWARHTATPEYIAREQVAEADAHVEGDDLVAASRLYAAVAAGTSPSAGDARKGLRALVEGPLADAPLDDVEQVCRRLVSLRGAPVVPDLDAWVGRLLARRGAAEPRAALGVLDAIRAPDDDPRRLPLLEAWVARDPSDLGATVALAVALEVRGEDARCRALLEPRTGELAGTEGARVLGQVFAREGRLDEAFDLLDRYARDKLARLHEAESAYNRVVDEVWNREIEKLDDGRGPEEFYRKFERADDAGKNQLVQEYVGARIGESRRVQVASDDVAREAGVVPVALDLGILRLRRAQAMSDAAARRAELEEAEKTFLAIRSLAGDRDDYQLFLGQVYHWMERAEEGDALFEALIGKHERRPDVLLAVVGTLREVGAFGRARALAEEAYAGAQPGEVKFRAAQLRALTAFDQEDTIRWLERGDPGNPAVRAELFGAKGKRALELGQDEEAVDLLRQAEAAYESLADSGATCNNRALVRFQLYAASGDRDVFTRGVEDMKAAVALQPGNSITLGNAASAFVEVAVLELVEGRIDVARLRARGAYDLLDHLAKDGAASAGWRAKLRAHPRVAEAREMLERVSVLAPRGLSGHRTALQLHRECRDLAGLRALHGRIMTTEFEWGDEEKEALAAMREPTDPDEIQALLRSLARTENRLTGMQDRPADATFAVAAARWTNLAIAALNEGVGDAATLTRWIESAHAAAPTDATARTMVHALLARTAHAVARTHEALDALMKAYRKSVGTGYLIAVALQDAGPLRDAILAHPDATRAIDVLVAHQGAFQDTPIPWDWAMLRRSRPAAAAGLAARLKASEAVRLYREAAFRLQPFDAGRAYALHWYRLATGDEKGAREVLEQCAARGVAMPPR